MRVAFATCAALPDGVDDDRETAALLDADVCVWDDPSVDWSAYDRVVLRSVWDYTWRLGDFLAWAATVGAQRLRNVPELVAFNADKRYLAELTAPTVPTLVVAPGERLPDLEGEVVVKPSVSGGARSTGRFGPAHHDEARALLRAIHEGGHAALVQPYLTDVDAHGETALVFFGGELSHVLRKRAVLAPNEVAPTTPGDPLGVASAMLADDLVTAAVATPEETTLARQVLAEVAERFGTPLYARVDLVRGPGGEPVLLELEVIEPSLYLDRAPGGAERLADAVRASWPARSGEPTHPASRGGPVESH